MEFRGPEPADFANVRSLNRAFLKLICRPTGGKRLRRQLSPLLEPLMAGLTTMQIQRLANAPFLLFSLRELGDVYWSEIFADDPTGDLFTPLGQPSPESGQLIAAALGFLWQLSSGNPYAARVVSGASLSWCERLSDVTFLKLIQCTAGRDDLLVLRHADNDNLWRKLLIAGINSEPEIRTSAHQCALQTMLTTAQSSANRPLSAAACRGPAPTLQVAEGPRPPACRKKL
jgi:hypothetical protein